MAQTKVENAIENLLLEEVNFLSNCSQEQLDSLIKCIINNSSEISNIVKTISHTEIA